MIEMKATGRGVLTEEIKALGRGFLGRDITTKELRLYPYLDSVMKNDQKLDMNKVNPVEREVLGLLRNDGHIEGGASGMSVTKEFYNYMQEVLWLGYVGAGH